MVSLKNILFIFLALVSSNLIASPEVINIDTGFRKIDIKTKAEYFLEKDSNYSLEEVLQSSDTIWLKLNNKSNTFGYIPNPVWIRFKINFKNPEDGYYYLRVNYPTLDSILLNIVNDRTGEIIYSKLQGDSLKFSERIIPSHVFPFPIRPDSADEWTIYIRVQTTASLSVPIEIMSPASYYEEETDLYLLFGFYFGLILTMFFYNFIVYLYNKDSVFVYYLVYLVSYFFVIFSGFGFASRYLYPNSVYLNNNFFLISVSLNAFSSILFSISFLRIKKFYPGFYKLVLSFLVAIAIWISSYLITSEQILYNFIAIFSFIPQIAILVLAIILFNRYQYARYFVLAWSFYLIMYGLSVARLVGVLPTNFVTYYGIQIGSAIEMLVLSFAIGRRLYEQKQRNDKLVSEIIENKKKTNTELMNLVEEKTLEIQNNLRLIEKDVEMARNLQLSTIPKNIDWTEQGLDVGTFFLPKDRVSGDIYDLCQFDEDRLRIFIADATGHGIQAGFFTMSIRTEYERIKYEHSETSQVLRLLNQSIFQTFGNETMLYSCFLIDIDLTQKYFQYSSAGHPEQFLYQDNELIEMKSTGPILGFSKDLPVRSKSIPINGDFKILLMTDGIIEAHDIEMNEFGSEKIIELLKNDDSEDCNDLLYNIYSESIAFSIDVGIEDDITMLYIRRRK